jgi:hypothetical protein
VLGALAAECTCNHRWCIFPKNNRTGTYPLTPVSTEQNGRVCNVLQLET